MKKKPRFILDIVMFCILIGGTIAVLYPFVSDVVMNFWDQQVINYYQKKANDENQEALEKEQLRLEQENQRIAKEARPGADPFSQKKPAAEQPTKDYFETHTIAILRIPKIHVELPIFDETNEAFLKRGTALLEGTSYPNGGASTHTVITGHRGLMEAKLFNDLPKLKKGNQFYIEINRRTLAYQVDQIETIEPTEIEALDIIKGKDYVTLLTCTPYGINSHRLLVRGRRIPFKAEMKKEIHKANQNKKAFNVAIIIGSILLLLLTGKLIKSKFKKRLIQN